MTATAAKPAPALKSAKPPKTLAELYELHEKFSTEAKALYDKKDAILKKIVRLWKKNKKAPVDGEHYLDIEDKFRGQTKAFAPGFAHRYSMKLRKLVETD